MILFAALITLFFILWGIIKKNSKAAAFGLIVLLYILFSFEKSKGDYLGYQEMFNQISYGSGRALTYEYLYVLLCRTASSLHMTFDTMRKIVCVFELWFLYSTIRKYTSNVAMVLGLFFIFPATLDAELFRWLLGMCIIIYAIQFLLKERGVMDYLVYAALVVIASLVHTSCWIFMIYLLMAMRDRKKLFRLVSIILAIGVAFAGTGLFFRLLSYLPIRTFVIQKYQTGNYANWHGILFAFIKQVVIFSMAVVATGRIKFSGGGLIIKKIDYSAVRTSMKEQSNELDIRKMLDERILDLNLVSFLILIPLFYSSSVQRLTHVVVFFNYIALANRCSIDKNNMSHTIYSASVATLLLLSLLFIESTGAVYAFTSHFTEGYFVNLFRQLF